VGAYPPSKQGSARLIPEFATPLVGQGSDVAKAVFACDPIGGLREIVVVNAASRNGNFICVAVNSGGEQMDQASSTHKVVGRVGDEGR